MSHHDTILAHLLDWSGSNRHEDTVTEGFAYLLRRYESVRERFVALLQGLEPHLPPDLRFATQQAAGEGRADMAGTSEGIVRVLVESKFGAALTGNQPLEYLAVLRTISTETLLLFIAPAVRKEWLWQELLGRLRGDSQTYTLVDGTPASAHAVRLDGASTVRLALLDWPSLFASLRENLTDAEAMGNLEQLAGLCRARQSHAWQPLRPEELMDRQVPTRMVHYLDIVHDAIAKAGPDVLGVPSRSGQSGRGWSGYKFQFAGPEAPTAWLGVNFWRWRDCGTGPIWLYFELKYRDLVEVRLRGWCAQAGRAFSHIDDGIMVHVELATACEQRAVVDNVVAQLRTIRDLLVAPTTSTSSC